MGDYTDECEIPFIFKDDRRKGNTKYEFWECPQCKEGLIIKKDHTFVQSKQDWEEYIKKEMG